ncbi:MAG TPA: UbiA family prenyltransferase [Syntrophomonadaceae bacterium]|nr:UbiA family prenyltransferase [Syntrophomonadaceae bacterium]
MALNKIKVFFSMIDISHSLFGLPFAYMGAFLAARGWPGGMNLIWITVAMVCARTAALCMNRLIDRDIDAANPRTSGWAIPSGQLSVPIIWGITFVFLALLFFAAYQLNPLCVKLAPLAVLVLWGYSYTKRFTWWCHFILGLAIGIGPAGGWIAITGTFDWQPFVLGMAVACWIAGFDIIYACQDIHFDRSHGLYSIPARFGQAGALRYSAWFHAWTVIFFILTGLILDLGLFYYLSVVFVAVILLYEHSLVRPGDLRNVQLAAFKINHYVGLIVFAVTLLDLYC